MSATYFLVVWMALKCPGGPLSRLIPAPLKPFVCHKTIEHQIFPDSKQARRQVRKVGCEANPRLFFYSGFRKWEKDIICTTKMTIEGEKPKPERESPRKLIWLKGE